MKKIFINGNSRSGTTLMSRILGNHKDVFTFQELHFFDELMPVNENKISQQPAQLYAALLATQRNGYFGSRKSEPFLEEAKLALNNDSQLTPIEIFGKFLENETERNNKSIPCEQTPQTIFSIVEVLEAFPDARIIIMVRDPRAVLLSQKYKWKRRKLSGGKIPFWESVRARINYHPYTISKIWNRVMKEAFRFENHPQVLFVKYEELIQNPDGIVKNVCTHCGIEYHPTMTNVPVVGSSHKSDTTSRGIENRESKWEKGLNSSEIKICQDINGEYMQKTGYQSIANHSGILTDAWYMISLPFQMVLALLFNLKRIRLLFRMK